MFKTFRITIRGFPALTNNINKIFTERKLILYMINKLTLNNGKSLSYQVSKSANKFFTSLRLACLSDGPYTRVGVGT